MTKPRSFVYEMWEFERRQWWLWLIRGFCAGYILARELL
jgi:hypothetical protein